MERQYGKNALTEQIWKNELTLQKVVTMFSSVVKTDQKEYRLADHQTEYFE